MTTIWSATLWLNDISSVDHEETGLSSLLWQYQDQPRIRAFLAAFLEEIDRLEVVAFELLTERSIYTAEGVQLDVLGRIVGQLRGGMSDDEYRIFLLGRIFVNRGDGTLAQYLELLGLLGVPAPWSLYDFWPAAFEVSATGIIYYEAIGELLFELKPAGVQLFWVHSGDDDNETFKTSSQVDADEVDADEGIANLAGLTGGTLMKLRWE